MSGNNDKIQNEVKLDENGRIDEEFFKNKVLTFSQRILSQHEMLVLSKGLMFVTSPKKIDYPQVEIDLENFGRRW